MLKLNQRQLNPIKRSHFAPFKSWGQLVSLFSMVMVLVVTAGCYPDWPEHAGSAVVQGTITLDGAPVGDAKIVFVPKKLYASETNLLPIAYGSTDATGRFDLAYSDGVKEIRAGTYEVIVSKIGSANDELDEQDNVLPNSGLIPDSLKSMHVFSNRGELIPIDYNRQSTLTFEIVASPGIVRPEFELKTVDSGLEELPVIDLPIK